jgi:hypothetical protein
MQGAVLTKPQSYRWLSLQPHPAFNDHEPRLRRVWRMELDCDDISDAAVINISVRLAVPLLHGIADLSPLYSLWLCSQNRHESATLLHTSHQA